MLSKAVKYGIAPRHITPFVPVSRVTASYWVNGRVAPDTRRFPELVKFLSAVNVAVADKTLPAPKELTGREVDNYVVATIKKHIKYQSAPSARPAK